MKSGMIREDLFKTLADSWALIDKRYKVAFFTAFVINILVYLVFIVHQPMHNHGILSRLLYTSPYEQFQAGRWFSFIIFNLFNSANLMVILPLVTIAIHIAGGILSVYLWDKKASTLSLTAGALIISLYPAVMTSFNFSFVGPIFSGPHILAPLSLILVSSRRFLNILSGSIVVCIMMATYQPGLSIILTIFMGFFIIKSFSFQGDLKAFRSLLMEQILPKIIAITVGCVLYKLSLPIFGIAISPTITTVNLADIPAKFILTFKRSFQYLLVTQPELLLTVKITLFLVCISAFVLLCYLIFIRSPSFKQAVFKFFLLSSLFLFLILSTKGMYFISANENFWIYRYNHALGYFYMFGFFIILRYLDKGILRNIAYIVLIFILIKFSYANIARQQLLLRAQAHHLAIANRLLYHIETLPGIDYEKKYKIVRIGKFSDFQLEHLKARGRTFLIGGDSHMDRELSPVWGPGDIFNYLGSKIKLQGYMNQNFKEDMAVAKKLVEDRKPWPADGSIFIHEDMIIIYL